MWRVAGDVWIGHAAHGPAWGLGRRDSARATARIPPPIDRAPRLACATTGAALGVRWGQLVTLLAIFLPNGTGPSRAM